MVAQALHFLFPAAESISGLELDKRLRKLVGHLEGQKPAGKIITYFERKYVII